ncbi:hypothetical protein [Azobacteroides phage ProJPt-Bp1]|uniref:Uncharacterized protein n=1 Tax=Azobacteroides phage ProJPt-Bp1 TaxID=1920526 RepID=A0A1V1G1V5_9CAUD|nr:hypothetical protein KNT10_gp20 [Azobacteroides phage ProJPt-Bp1]BAX03443.1 hypothetical protein [Azobacteroides phage ProJPt-Bp1]
MAVDYTKAAVSKGEIYRKWGEIKKVTKGHGATADNVMVNTSPDFAVLGNTIHPLYGVPFKTLGERLYRRFNNPFYQDGDELSESSKALNHKVVNEEFDKLLQQQEQVNQMEGNNKQFADVSSTQYQQNAYGGAVPRYAQGGSKKKSEWESFKEGTREVGSSFADLGRQVKENFWDPMPRWGKYATAGVGAGLAGLGGYYGMIRPLYRKYKSWKEAKEAAEAKRKADIAAAQRGKPMAENEVIGTNEPAGPKPDTLDKSVPKKTSLPTQTGEEKSIITPTETPEVKMVGPNAMTVKQPKIKFGKSAAVQEHRLDENNDINDAIDKANRAKRAANKQVRLKVTPTIDKPRPLIVGDNRPDYNPEGAIYPPNMKIVRGFKNVRHITPGEPKAPSFGLKQDNPMLKQPLTNEQAQEKMAQQLVDQDEFGKVKHDSDTAGKNIEQWPPLKTKYMDFPSDSGDEPRATDLYPPFDEPPKGVRIKGERFFNPFEVKEFSKPVNPIMGRNPARVHTNKLDLNPKVQNKGLTLEEMYAPASEGGRKLSDKDVQKLFKRERASINGKGVEKPHSYKPANWFGTGFEGGEGKTKFTPHPRTTERTPVYSEKFFPHGSPEEPRANQYGNLENTIYEPTGKDVLGNVVDYDATGQRDEKGNFIVPKKPSVVKQRPPHKHRGRGSYQLDDSDLELLGSDTDTPYAGGQALLGDPVGHLYEDMGPGLQGTVNPFVAAKRRQKLIDSDSDVLTKAQFDALPTDQDGYSIGPDVNEQQAINQGVDAANRDLPYDTTWFNPGYGDQPFAEIRELKRTNPIEYIDAVNAMHAISPSDYKRFSNWHGIHHPGEDVEDKTVLNAAIPQFEERGKFPYGYRAPTLAQMQREPMFPFNYEEKPIVHKLTPAAIKVSQGKKALGLTEATPVERQVEARMESLGNFNDFYKWAKEDNDRYLRFRRAQQLKNPDAFRDFDTWRNDYYPEWDENPRLFAPYDVPSLKNVPAKPRQAEFYENHPTQVGEQDIHALLDQPGLDTYYSDPGAFPIGLIPQGSPTRVGNVRGIRGEMQYGDRSGLGVNHMDPYVGSFMRIALMDPVQQQKVRQQMSPAANMQFDNWLLAYQDQVTQAQLNKANPIQRPTWGGGGDQGPVLGNDGQPLPEPSKGLTMHLDQNYKATGMGSGFSDIANMLNSRPQGQIDEAMQGVFGGKNAPHRDQFIEWTANHDPDLYRQITGQEPPDSLAQSSAAIPPATQTPGFSSIVPPSPYQQTGSAPQGGPSPDNTPQNTMYPIVYNPAPTGSDNHPDFANNLPDYQADPQGFMDYIDSFRNDDSAEALMDYVGENEPNYPGIQERYAAAQQTLANQATMGAGQTFTPPPQQQPPIQQPVQQQPDQFTSNVGVGPQVNQQPIQHSPNRYPLTFNQMQGVLGVSPYSGTDGFGDTPIDTYASDGGTLYDNQGMPTGDSIPNFVPQHPALVTPLGGQQQQPPVQQQQQQPIQQPVQQQPPQVQWGASHQYAPWGRPGQ